MGTIAWIQRDVSNVLAMFEQYRPMIAHGLRVAADFQQFRPVLDYGRRIVEDIERFRRDTQIISDCYRDTVRKYLADRGWYVGPSLSGRNIVNLAEAIEHGGAEAAIEAAISSHVRANAGAVEAAVLTHWPHRRAILTDAFEAHKKGSYTLSIPVFLAQADGMAFDILKALIFTDHAGKIADKAKELIDAEAKNHGLMCSFVGILLEWHSIRARTSIRDQRKSSGAPVSSLNRHGVLHGIDLDYATEANSLRAISLLSLLTDLHKLKDKSEPD